MIRDGILAIYELLNADADVKAVLSTHAFGPAIFTGSWEPPPDARHPFLWIIPEAYAMDDTSGGPTSGSRQTIAVEVYCDKTFSREQLDDISEKVRTALHGKQAIPVGKEDWLVFCQVVDVSDRPPGEQYVVSAVICELFTQRIPR